MHIQKKKNRKKSTGSNAYTNSKLSAINVLSTMNESEKNNNSTEVMRMRCGMKRIKKEKKEKKNSKNARLCHAENEPKFFICKY